MLNYHVAGVKVQDNKIIAIITGVEVHLPEEEYNIKMPTD